MSGNNLNTYNLPGVIKWYTQLDTIIPVEKFLFETYKSIISKGNILDIGVGGGRTTAYLIDKCSRYTGIDYAQGFVGKLKSIYPAIDIRCMDARDLSGFEDNNFDFINFSFNGIDYVDAEGRTKILKEVNRVLKPGGIFFFSTHNKSHSSFNVFPWLNKTNSLVTNLKTFIKLLPFLPKHFHKKKQEIYTNDHAIINDSAHQYSLLTFYTTPQFLETELLNSNFSSINLYLKNGNKVSNNNCDDWIFVTCRKSLS